MGFKKEVFELDSINFDDGWKIISESILEIKELFNDITTKNEVQKKMLELINENMPNYETGENIFWNLLIQSNKVILKTDKKISVGWSISDNGEYKFKIILHTPNMIYQKAMLESVGFKQNINYN